MELIVVAAEAAEAAEDIQVLDMGQVARVEVELGAPLIMTT
jgi:hypothetical protein